MSECGPTPEAVGAAAKALGGKDDYRRRDGLRILRAAQGSPRASEVLADTYKTSSDANTRSAIWQELCNWPALSPGALTVVARGLAAAETRGDARGALLGFDRDRLVALGAHPYLVFMAQLRVAMAREPGTFEEF